MRKNVFQHALVHLVEHSIKLCDRFILAYDLLFFPRTGDLITAKYEMHYDLDYRVVRRLYERDTPTIKTGELCIFMGRLPGPTHKNVNLLEDDGAIVIKHGSIDVFVPDRLISMFRILAKGSR